MLVVMVGGPAAGKSTVAQRDYPNLPRVDADIIKEEHPDYDPKNPVVVHRWSVEESVKRVLGYLSRGTPVVYDGTGTNVERLASLVAIARASGMKVEACFVTCPVEVAVARNAARPRTVAEDVVRAKHEMAAESWPIVRALVDSHRVVDTE